MPETIDTLKQAQELLKAGRVQDAADLMAGHQRELEDEAAAAAGKPREPRPPRSPGEVIGELLASIVAHLGNRPEHVALLDEFHAGAEKPPA